MRGQHGLSLFLTICPRIIPARAGPTLADGTELRPDADHPRSCGANPIVGGAHPMIIGSSPLVRGQRISPQFCIPYVRIIPARAGPTRLPQRRRRRFPDHPRSCGANDNYDEMNIMLAGSSPLVRGQPNVAHVHVCAFRIIPARAGPTYLRSTRPVSVSDHPRSCGANAVSAMAVAC